MLGAIPFETLPIIHLGPIPVRTFGLFVAVGILVGVQVLLRFARRRGLPVEPLSSLAFQVVGFGILGARLLYVMTRPGEFADDPLSVFALWEGGLQFSGSFLIAIPVIVRWVRRNPGYPGLLLTDGIVYALVPGMMIGRCGCCAVGEHLGGPTEFFLGWKYLGGETREGPLMTGVTYHNTALYEIIGLAPLLLVMMWMSKRRVPPGVMSATFFLWYGVQRFLTDLLRTADIRVAGLTGAQYLALGMILGGLYILRNVRRGGSGSQPEPDAAAA